MSMEIKEIKCEDGRLTAGLSGRMDAITAPEFSQQLEIWIAEGKKNFVIDCSKLDYISSAGLRSILITAKKIKALEGIFQLATLQESVHNVFEISGFDKIIPILANLDEVEAQ